jgi:hypothetical protein
MDQPVSNRLAKGIVGPATKTASILFFGDQQESESLTKEARGF